jgi:macrolide transport system ATP-binding/permease protein
VIQDLRYAFRMMASQPLFTAMAVLSLALGIGANTAIYSFMDAILLRSLPVQDPGSLVILSWHSKARDTPAVVHNHTGSWFNDPKMGATSPNFPYPSFALLREKTDIFSSVFAYSNGGRLNVQVRGQAGLAASQYVSSDFFKGLGVPAAAGRLIGESDDRFEAAPVAVISYGYAHRRFGDPASAAGQPILIDNQPFTIAGVTAPEFFGVNPAGAQDVYLPMHTSVLLETRFVDEQRSKYDARNFYWAEIMARLRPGVSREQAEATVAPLFASYVESTASNDKERTNMPALALEEGGGGLDGLRRQYSKPLYVLMTLVGLILAIACANIANLLLARSAARRREIAVRLGLGAARMRVVRQLLTESMLLASLGGLLGLVVAEWGIDGLTWLLANGRENFTLHAELNWRVLSVTLAVAVGTGVLFGLAPALQSTRLDLISALKQARDGEQGSRVNRWLPINLTQGLAVVQIAMSALLLIAAGIFVRSLSNLNSVQIGFNRENLLLVGVNARQTGYRDDALFRFYSNLQTRFSGLPGVRSASLTNFAPVSGGRSTMAVHIPGQPDSKIVSMINVGPGFFSTLQIPMLLGREIDESDLRGRRHVAVVSDLFATKYFGGQNPVGRHFSMRADVDYEIVGVAKTARLHSLKMEVPPVVYSPYTDGGQSLAQVFFVLRTGGDPLGLAQSARQVVREADARIPVASLATQASTIERTMSQERTFATLCSAFAGLAVVIACVGLYGMMAYRVARRTNEIGIRMALGAERRRIVWMVVREVVAIGIVGIGMGVPAALALAPMVKTFLFQIKPNDPPAVGAAAAAMLAAVILAGYWPAWRASKIDPWTALRDE